MLVQILPMSEANATTVIEDCFQLSDSLDAPFPSWYRTNGPYIRFKDLDMEIDRVDGNATFTKFRVTIELALMFFVNPFTVNSGAHLKFYKTDVNGTRHLCNINGVSSSTITMTTVEVQATFTSFDCLQVSLNMSSSLISLQTTIDVDRCEACDANKLSLPAARCRLST